MSSSGSVHHRAKKVSRLWAEGTGCVTLGRKDVKATMLLQISEGPPGGSNVARSHPPLTPAKTDLRPLDGDVYK